MHLFTAHRRKGEPGQTLRFFAHMVMPDNPVCWWRGHSPKIEVQRPGYDMSPWLLITCRVCGRRYDDHAAVRELESLHDEKALTAREYRAAQAARAKEIYAARVANAEADPKAFLVNVDRRRHWHDNDLHLSLEVTTRPKGHRDSAGFAVHLGNRGSETPYDGHVDVGVAAAYWSIGGVSGRLAELLGRGHKRDLSLKVHSGSLWWRLWYDDDGGHDRYHRCDTRRRPRLWPWSAGRAKHRSWMCLRDGNIALNPLDAFWGHRLFHYTDVEAPRTAFIRPDPADQAEAHLVEFALQRVERHRDHGPAWARRPEVSWSVSWRSEAGIPFRNDSWKGDNTYASAVRVDEEALEKGWWLEAAVRALEADIAAQRERYGYRKHPVTEVKA